MGAWVLLEGRWWVGIWEHWVGGRWVAVEDGGNLVKVKVKGCWYSCGAWAKHGLGLGVMVQGEGWRVRVMG